MKLFLSLSFSILVILGFFKALGYGTYMMNLKSDLFAVLGLFICFTTGFLLSYTLKLIWRKRKNEVAK